MQIKETFSRHWLPSGSAYGYDLTIPAGTPVHTVQGGQGPLLAVAATPAMLAPGETRDLAERPRSLFRHEAEHHWVFVGADDVREG